MHQFLWFQIVVLQVKQQGGLQEKKIDLILWVELIYQENKQHQSALSCLFEALERNKHIFGPDHNKVAGCFQAIAITHFEIDDIKKAIEYQEKCVSIFKKVINNYFIV